MTSSVFFPASALAVLLSISAAPAARACTVDVLTLTCTGASAAQSSNASGLVVSVEAGASVTKANTAPNGPALLLSGNNVTVDNDGQIINLRTNNNDANAAIQGTGSNLTIANSGTISSGDRAIHITGGTGGFTLTNEAGATITARRQAVRTLNDLALPNSTVTNYGTISSTTDRALQFRGAGARVYNYGTMTGGDEVIEGREDFYLENTGTIAADPASTDADGAQFASGTVINEGLISGTDDGLDVDEGYIFNAASGTIRARASGSGSGIDIDPTYEPSDLTKSRPAGDLTIVNEGLIEGPTAIGSDPAAQNRITVRNSGTLLGNSGKAVDFAPGQGDSTVENSGSGRILGDILFGAGNDVFRLSELDDSAAIDGVIDGSGGTDTVELFYSLYDIVSFTVTDAGTDLTLKIASGGLFTASFLNFDRWTLSDRQTYTSEDLALAVAAVPLPAGLPLLLAGLAALAIARRSANRRT